MNCTLEKQLLQSICQLHQTLVYEAGVNHLVAADAAFTRLLTFMCGLFMHAKKTNADRDNSTVTIPVAVAAVNRDPNKHS